MEALGFNLGFLALQVFNFLIVMIVLTAWAYRPIVNLLEQRRQRIAQGLEDARIAAEARANAEKEAEKIMQAASADANKRVAEATERAEKAGAETLAAVQEERQRILRAAQDEAEAERNRILGELRGQVAALAMAAANKIVGESLDEKRQHSLIQEFFSGVRAGQISVVDGDSFSGAGAVEVTSALPLTPEEQEMVRKDIASRQGGASSVVFRVDPSILGGLVIRIGDKVLDGSVAGKMEGMRANLH